MDKIKKEVKKDVAKVKKVAKQAIKNIKPEDLERVENQLKDALQLIGTLHTKKSSNYKHTLQFILSVVVFAGSMLFTSNHSAPVSVNGTKISIGQDTIDVAKIDSVYNSFNTIK